MTLLTSHQIAALAFDKHISLTANAGSGKTTVLATRYVEILLNKNVSMNNIVAITFTERAAGELYSKIAKELESRISVSLGKDRRRLENIRRGLVSAKISTIHSFCLDILKDFAPEAGIDANFFPIDTRTADDILYQSIDEVISQNLKDNREEIKYLIRIFGNRAQLVTKSKQLFSKRKTTEYLVNHRYDKDINEIASFYKYRFEELLGELFIPIFNRLYDNVTLINSLAAESKSSEKQSIISQYLKDSFSQKSLIEKIILLNNIKNEVITGTGKIAMKGYLTQKIFKENEALINETAELFNEIKELEIDENYECYNTDLARFGKNLSDLYRMINQRYQVRKNQKSFLDFEDLLILTQNLMSNKRVKDELSDKYKYIMIDEYQDTNETQYNIFMPILNNLNTGNLFIVGDEKQSIYMFREADVELFSKTKNEINNISSSPGLLELPHSFRLAPNIAQFTNSLFEKLFSAPNHIFNEVENNDLICAYKGDDRGEVEFLIADENVISEAELVSRKIIQLVEDDESDCKFSDITILCTRRKNFAELENIFSKNNIPFNIVGGKGFYQQQLILDIYNYISFLVNPQNDIALAAILRSPFYGFSDLQLTELVLADGSRLFDKLKVSSNFKSAYSLLRSHLEYSKVLRPNEIIRKITKETGYWAYIAEKQNSDQEIANMNKLIEKSIKIDDQGFNTLFDFVYYLKDAINNLEDEGQAEMDHSSNSVKIMTVHQAKGLEFRVVFIFKTNQKFINEKLKSKEIIVDKDFGILSKLPLEDNYFEDYRQAPVISMYNYLQKRKSLAEHKRLLYVALTRAEKHLIISMGGKKNKIYSDSFAEMIFSNFPPAEDRSTIELSGELSFMELENDQYVIKKENIHQHIRITRNIDEKLINKEVAEVEELTKINVDPFLSSEKNEIISASKISLFLNCPRKYQLTYEYGYGELTKLFINDSDIELNIKEDELNIPGSLFGNVLHSLLERNVEINQVDTIIGDIIAKNTSGSILKENEKMKLISETKEVLNKFYNLDIFSRINSFSNFFNEIEFYKREKDYFLYGIIDKLIINGDKILVVDYKSDRINSGNYEEKIDTYSHQLLFYAYLILNEFPEAKEFELLMIFLRDPNYTFSKVIKRIEVEKFGHLISTVVHKIRNKKFDEKRKGCRNMHHYLLSEK